MGVLRNLRRRIGSGQRHNRAQADAAALLVGAERRIRCGCGRDAAALGGRALELLLEIDGGSGAERDLRLGAAYCYAGELGPALRHARAAAMARPYDVDSRLALGNTRLARGELDEAAHEFDAVIEEFGADPEAASGRRAAILARGEAPVDELAAGPAEWEAAARLLVGLWSAAGLLDERLKALRGGNPATLALLESAVGAADRGP